MSADPSRIIWRVRAMSGIPPPLPSPRSRPEPEKVCRHPPAGGTWGGRTWGVTAVRGEKWAHPAGPTCVWFLQDAHRTPQVDFKMPEEASKSLQDASKRHPRLPEVDFSCQLRSTEPQKSLKS